MNPQSIDPAAITLPPTHSIDITLTDFVSAYPPDPDR